jgi:hypothetical protein
VHGSPSKRRGGFGLRRKGAYVEDYRTREKPTKDEKGQNSLVIWEIQHSSDWYSDK